MGLNIKICGITNEEDGLLSFEAGANAIGIIIGESRSFRSVSIMKAGEIMNCLPSSVTKVVVTPCSSIDKLIEIKQEVKPDVIQLQEELPTEVLINIRKKLPNTKLIGVIPLGEKSRFEDFIPMINIMEYAVDAINLDSRSTNGRIGGSGKIHNWEVSKQIRDYVYPKPVILAGGLTPQNVSHAIDVVRPWGVDVASGVEYNRNGRKNPSLVSEFIRIAKLSSSEVIEI